VEHLSGETGDTSRGIQLGSPSHVFTQSLVTMAGTAVKGFNANLHCYRRAFSGRRDPALARPPRRSSAQGRFLQCRAADTSDMPDMTPEQQEQLRKAMEDPDVRCPSRGSPDRMRPDARSGGKGCSNTCAVLVLDNNKSTTFIEFS
jgi:hypothetical protein